MPDKAKDIVDLFADWGVNRFSVKWDTRNMRELFDQMDIWGHEINIYGIPDLEAFLQAVLLMPKSITSDYNFPKWYYFGKGSGENGGYYQYQEVWN